MKTFFRDKQQLMMSPKAFAMRAVFLGVVICMSAAVFGATWTGEITSALWTLPSAGTASRWLEIHNLSGARGEGLFHIEVLERDEGDPLWKFRRLAPHMAITEAALRASIVKPLSKGSVYPESHDEAYREWRIAREAGHAFICTSNVTVCLGEIASSRDGGSR